MVYRLKPHGIDPSGFLTSKTSGKPLAVPPAQDEHPLVPSAAGAAAAVGGVGPRSGPRLPPE